MADLFLGCMALLLFVAGFRLMKKIDSFIENNMQNIFSEQETSALRIAFEHPEDIMLADDIMRIMKQNNFNEKIYFYYGSAEEIKQCMKNGKTDLIFLDPYEIKKMDSKCCLLRIFLCRRSLQYTDSDIWLHPLVSEKSERVMVWEQTNCKEGLSMIIKYFSDYKYQRSCRKDFQKGGSY